jgi:hypothetical protein
VRAQGSLARASAGGWVTGVVVTLVALATSMLLPPAVGLRPDSTPAPLLRSVTGLGLVVDPPSWWLTAGNRTQLAATWTGIQPGCVAEPLWFRWTLASGFADGTLEPTEGPSVNFTAGFTETGTAAVEARSTVLLTCGSNQEAMYDTAGSAITVVAPLRIENVSLSPDPVATGASSDLSGLLVGGQPPYQVRIGWDDGNVTVADVSAPGPFSFSHGFGNGSFSPSIVASDATGLRANGSVDGPLSVSSGFTVALATPTVAAEVGVPVRFSGEILHPPAEYGSVTQCTDASSNRPAESAVNVSTQNFTCTFAAPGSAEVDFEVVPINDDLPIEEARWWEPVAPSLAVSVVPPGGTGEMGLPTVFTVRLSGGVPPFLVIWQLAGNSTLARAPAYADGSILIPVWPSEPGTYALSVTVRDALGVLVTAGTVPLPVEPPLDVSAAADRTLSSTGAFVQVAGTVSQGAAPFHWWVLPGVTPTTESAPNGTLPSVAPFSWNGTLAREGNSTVSIVVVDGAGAVGWETIPVSLVPELRASAQAHASSVAKGPSLLLNLSVEGGLPPFDLRIHSDAGEGWNRSLPADGTYSFTFPTNDSGSTSLELTLRDPLGAEWTDTLLVDLPSTTPPSNGTGHPPPTRPPSNVTPTALPSSGVSDLIDLVVVAGAGAAALAVLWRRWHRPTRASVPPVDPVEVLRRILEPADGAERSTVELMAEEAGVPLEAVHSTIDRLVSEGSIRSESGPDGEEVLAWSPEDRP